jgi:polo-like kinase 1
LVLDPSKRPSLDDILEDPFMSTEPIPKTIPRSTLACPPAKNFTDIYKGTQGQTKTSKNDTSGELMQNKDSEKNLNAVSNKPNRDSNEKDQFAGTATNFKNKDQGKTATTKPGSKPLEQKNNS